MRSVQLFYEKDFILYDSWTAAKSVELVRGSTRVEKEEEKKRQQSAIRSQCRERNRLHICARCVGGVKADAVRGPLTSTDCVYTLCAGRVIYE